MKREAPEFSPHSDSFLVQTENSSSKGFLHFMFAPAVGLLCLVLLSVDFMVTRGEELGGDGVGCDFALCLRVGFPALLIWM